MLAWTNKHKQKFGAIFRTVRDMMLTNLKKMIPNIPNDRNLKTLTKYAQDKTLWNRLICKVQIKIRKNWYSKEHNHKNDDHHEQTLPPNSTKKTSPRSHKKLRVTNTSNLSCVITKIIIVTTTVYCHQSLHTRELIIDQN